LAGCITVDNSDYAAMSTESKFQGPVHTGDKAEFETVDFFEFDEVDRMSKGH